jgi:hypothetical protein
VPLPRHADHGAFGTQRPEAPPRSCSRRSEMYQDADADIPGFMPHVCALEAMASNISHERLDNEIGQRTRRSFASSRLRRLTHVGIVLSARRVAVGRRYDD